MSKIYVASSWRNDFQPGVVEALRAGGHEVYDFRNPPHGRGGFAWSEIDQNWESWTADQYRKALDSQIARAGFASDLTGMMWADTCVLLLPCGRSAHLEAGWMAGRGKRVLVLTRDGQEPELMALLCDRICVSVDEVLHHLNQPRLGTPISELSGRPGETGYERFKTIAESWGY